MLPLDQSEVHLWYVFPDILTDPRLLEAYHDLMCPSERAQQQRFSFQKGQHEYLVAHALVRTVLSCYVGVDSRLSYHFMDFSVGEKSLTIKLKAGKGPFSPSLTICFSS